MPENEHSAVKQYRLRAHLPRILGGVAAGLIALTILFLGLGFYRGRSNPEFRMKGFPTSLSQDVVAEVDGYERRETEGDVVKYYIKADHARTFSDNHQELQNVYLQVFDPTGQSSDQITAAKAVYVPEANKNFTAFLAGDVNIGTRDGLVVKTEQVTYKRSDETASADEEVNFERDNVKGRAFGALVNVPEKRLELHHDVFIETLGGSAGAPSSVKYASLNAGSATYDQKAEKIELRGSVKIAADTTDGLADIAATTANVYLSSDGAAGRDAKRIELFQNVAIKAEQKGRPPTNISSEYALFEKDIDKFTLRDAVSIATVESDKPVNVTANSALYERPHGKVFLEGNAQVTQSGDLVKGDRINAELSTANSLKFASVKGNSYLKQAAADRVTEISAADLDAAFNDQQQLTQAHAVGNVVVLLVPVNVVDYSKVSLSAPSSANVTFKSAGRVDKMETAGRTIIQLYAPDNVVDGSNKRVTADSVRALFNDDGSALRHAEAVGNSELYVEPRQSGPEIFKTTITAPRFDCEFFETGNDARLCTATTKTRTVRMPTQPTAQSGTQTLLADKVSAAFGKQSRDIQLLEADGAAKFTELDRNAVADKLTFSPADGYVRLRAGDPTVWDSAARARADEIDWDTKGDKSGLRGKVRTTYYSQKQTGGATPFGETDKPVYVTAASAEFDHKAETGLYMGAARGWQENNFVTADRFVIRQREGQFVAEGGVKSLLYNAKRRENGKDSNVPVYATAARMTYERDQRLLRYENAVDIRQGTDRITGGTANVYLNDNNEVAKTDVESNVVITQPNRKASGDFAQYLSAEESVVLRGNPARVFDAENGTSQAAQLTVYLKENRVIGEGKSKQNPNGRSRSVYKVGENIQ
jgi:lipopolysaccharide export system protein LptA